VASLAARAAAAQTINAARPATFVTGTPGGARFDRVDAARTGSTSSTLPASALRTAWHASLGITIEQPPLVDAQDTTYVAGARGEVVALGPQGDERWRVSTASVQPGPLALLSDDSLVFVDAAGEAVAVHHGSVRWRTRFGRGGTYRPAPLPLDDGGVVVATSHELAVLDAEGQERSRVVLSEPAASPLIAAGTRVIVVSAGGTVWQWSPGASEARRVSSFGGPIDGAAALSGGHTLFAVTGRQAHLTGIDLDAGRATVRVVAPGGRWLGPPALAGDRTYLELLAPAGELAIAVDETGAELGRAVLALHPGTGSMFAGPSLDGGPEAGPPADVDGGAGAPASSSPPHTPPIVDRSGTLAFATIDGAIGVVTHLSTGSPAVEIVVDACPPTLTANRTSAPVAGLAPFGATGGFVSACASGTVLAVRSGGRSACAADSAPTGEAR